VDGFRVDVIWHIAKDEQFRDNPRNPDYKPGQNPHHEFLATYTADQTGIHDIIREMRQVLDAYPSRMMVGEIYLPLERLVTYYGEGGAGVHMPFNFQLVTLKWDARTVDEAIRKYEQSLPSYGWPNWVLGNHDNSRIASRIGAAQARVAAMMLLTLRGTPTLYYGDEIGMRDVRIPPDRIQDPFEKNVPGIGLGRDPERTPMQWDAGPNAGFAPAKATPWLPLADDYAKVNVVAQRKDSRSMLSLHRRLIALRRDEAALSTGSYESVDGPDDVVAYVRRDDETGRRFLVVLNLCNEPRTFLPTGGGERRIRRIDGPVVLSTHLDREGDAAAGEITLRADEGVIIRLT
jgi:alpha-glucosidase